MCIALARAVLGIGTDILRILRARGCRKNFAIEQRVEKRHFVDIEEGIYESERKKWEQ